ncbi:MAG: heme-binding domain-containing protein [Planctomycetes bacterium]|nr:heme-binding domain-containing protein [Planctomycetota bacterium]
MPEKKKRRFLKPLLLGALALAAAIQLVPYGRDHSNPAVATEPKWDSAATRDLAKRACFDCHSNETEWPWYSHVAPVSWLVQRDVNEGRSELNFSEWNRPQKNGQKAAKEVRDGEMPMWIYLPTHPQARLSDAEKQALIQGLEATFGTRESPRKGDD